MNILDIRVQKLFVIALALKVLASGLGWYYQSPWALGFAAPLAIMAAYIGLGLYRRDSDVSDEKFADSAYYLGFIFTITSIIFSLFDLPNIGTRFQDISVRFGAAMVSTVLGLGVRVYLVSFRADAIDAMRDAEDALLGAAQTFTERLKMSLERLQDFESRVDLAARASVERVNMQVEAMSKNHADKLTDFFADLTSRNQDAFTNALGEVRGASSRLSDSVDGYASGMKSHLESIEDRVSAFAAAVSSRLQNTTFPDDYFAKRLEAPLTQLQTAAGDIARQVLNAGHEMAKTADTLTNSLSVVQEKSGQAESAMDSILRLAGQQHMVLETAQGQLNALALLSSKLETFDSLLTSMTGELRDGHLVNQALTTQVGSMVKESVESREAIERSLSTVAEQLRQQAVSNEALTSRMDATVAASASIVSQLGDSAAAQVAASSHLETSANLAKQVAAKYDISIEAEQASARALTALGERTDQTLTKVGEVVDSLHEVVRLAGVLADRFRDQDTAARSVSKPSSDGDAGGTTARSNGQPLDAISPIPTQPSNSFPSNVNAWSSLKRSVLPEVTALKGLQNALPAEGAREPNGTSTTPPPPVQG